MSNQVPKKHEVQIDPDDPSMIIEVWVKELTFLDIQKSVEKLLKIGKDGSIGLNLEGYWKYAFSHWIQKTNPSLTVDDMMSLTGYVGEQMSQILPKPQDIAEQMQAGFTKASL
jgi:hypothetical protein